MTLCPGALTQTISLIIIDLDNPKLIIDGHINLPVKVLHGDTKAVTALGGELVNVFETEPQLAWDQVIIKNVWKLASVVFGWMVYLPFDSKPSLYSAKLLSK